MSNSSDQTSGPPKRRWDSRWVPGFTIVLCSAMIAMSLRSLSLNLGNQGRGKNESRSYPDEIAELVWQVVWIDAITIGVMSICLIVSAVCLTKSLKKKSWN